MLEMIRRIFKIAGRSRQKIIVGITFNILKSFFNGFMMFGVFWILLHLENLTPTIILQSIQNDHHSCEQQPVADSNCVFLLWHKYHPAGE